jgi:hypothetical protein
VHPERNKSDQQQKRFISFFPKLIVVDQHYSPSPDSSMALLLMAVSIVETKWRVMSAPGSIIFLPFRNPKETTLFSVACLY